MNITSRGAQRIAQTPVFTAPNTDRYQERIGRLTIENIRLRKQIQEQARQLAALRKQVQMKAEEK